MKRSIWLSFDLGVKGDYDSLYAYLDNMGAVECGDNFAFFKMEFAGSDAELESAIEEGLKAAVTLSKNDRIYMIYRKSDDKQMRGKFLFGTRKASPWQGFGQQDAGEDDGI